MRLIASLILIFQLAAAGQLSRKEEYQQVGAKLLEQIPNPNKPGERPEPEVAREYVRTLRNLATDTVLEALTQSAPTDRPANVRRGIQELQRGLNETEWTNLPYAEKAAVNGHEVMIVAFSVLQGAAAIPEPTPFLQFYVPEGERWRLAAEAPNDLEGRATRVALLKGPVGHEVWLLTWGRRYGDNRAVVSARVYAFDGASVRSIWQRDDLIGGELAVNDGTVSVSYFQPGRLGDPPVVEEYKIGFHGLLRSR
jgi:hypothetical protein